MSSRCFAAFVFVAVALATETATASFVPVARKRASTSALPLVRQSYYQDRNVKYGKTSTSSLGLFGLDGDVIPTSWLDELSSKVEDVVSNSMPNQLEKTWEQEWTDLESRLNLDLSFPSVPPLDLQLPSTDYTITFTFSKPTWLNSLDHAYAQLPLWGQVAVVLVPIAALICTALYQLSFPSDDYRNGLEPYPRGRYDPIQAKAYYASHPKAVLQRSLQLVRLSNQFIIGLLLDKYVFKNEEDPKQRTKRATELLALITKLGPTAIKVGQALSVRPDIIPTEYATALATLQDKVPPFSSAAARSIVMDELGKRRYNQLQGIATTEPVASASIGQVYKATINTSDGTDLEVAIKVQRPNVLSDIALDLHIVREFAPIYQKYIARSSTDLQTLANEWGRGFIAELDYRAEAASTTRFNEEMKKRALDAVTAPVVVEEYSTEQVLATEWVDGVRIDESDEDDIPRLCSVALNAYLVMLLELRSLHCDPHPGNLLRTTDGRLCILDFGMTLDVDPTLQYSLLEYLAHVTSDDYEKIPEDLVNMGFLKAEKLDFAKRSGILEPLKYFLREAGKGGGARGVRERILGDFRERYPGLNDDEIRKKAREDMKAQMREAAQKESIATGITTEVEELQRQNRDSFTIPPWFVYTSRAFGTLEGVSLQADENYSLVQSCFPYIAKRLVGDDSPRAQKALKELLYGAGDSIDVTRLGDLADGFSTYTTTTKTLNAIDNDAGVTTVAGSSDSSTPAKDPKTKLVEAEAAITLAKDSADVLFAPGGNLVQNLLLEETTLATSARIKDQVKETLVDAPQKFRDSLPFGVGSFLPPLPVEALAPFVEKTESERKAQQLIDKLARMVPQLNNNSLNTIVNGDAPVNGNNNNNAVAGIDTEALNALLNDLEPEQAALVVKELRENLPKYAPMVGQLGNKFIASKMEFPTLMGWITSEWCRTAVAEAASLQPS